MSAADGRLDDSGRGRQRLAVGSDEGGAVEDVGGVVRARRAADVHEGDDGARRAGSASITTGAAAGNITVD